MPRKQRDAVVEHETRQPNNTAIYDIETTNLTANYGIMLCAVVKPLHMTPKTFRLDLYRGNVREEDKELIRALIKELEKYDFLITYNGIRFDTKFINTRALFHKINPLSEKLHIDMLMVARRVLRTNNRRLDTIVNFFDLEEKKTAIDPKYWRWAMMGDREAMDQVCIHCVQDTKTLELVYEKLAPYIKNVRKQ